MIMVGFILTCLIFAGLGYDLGYSLGKKKMDSIWRDHAREMRFKALPHVNFEFTVTSTIEGNQ